MLFSRLPLFLARAVRACPRQIPLQKTPALQIFTIFQDQNSTFSLFETFGKKLAETKIVASVNVKIIKAKKIEKRLLNLVFRRFLGRC
jgi:hypothetical protein